MTQSPVMAPSTHDLARGEYVIFHAHSHWKVLTLPVLVFLVCAGGVGAWFALTTPATRPQWLTWLIIAAASIIVIIWAVAPFIRWATRTDTLTNHRLISREGVFNRRGRDIPISRVHAITYERTFLERILGAGTLIVQTAADSSDVVLEDVARVKRRHLQIQEELLGIDFPDVEPDDGGPHPDPTV
jgi:uncharacterized membrane protein YdbT with pleckstrin-like domain